MTDNSIQEQSIGISVRYYNTFKKIIGLIVAFIAFAGISINCSIIALDNLIHHRPDTSSLYIPAIAFGLFAIALFFVTWAEYRTWRTGSGWVINKQGIYIRRWFSKKMFFIPWSDVTYLKGRKIDTGKYHMRRGVSNDTNIMGYMYMIVVGTKSLIERVDSSHFWPVYESYENIYVSMLGWWQATSPGLKTNVSLLDNPSYSRILDNMIKYLQLDNFSYDSK